MNVSVWLRVVLVAILLGGSSAQAERKPLTPEEKSALERQIAELRTEIEQLGVRRDKVDAERKKLDPERDRERYNQLTDEYWAIDARHTERVQYKFELEERIRRNDANYRTPGPRKPRENPASGPESSPSTKPAAPEAGAESSPEPAKESAPTTRPVILGQPAPPPPLKFDRSNPTLPPSAVKVSRPEVSSETLDKVHEDVEAFEDSIDQRLTQLSQVLAQVREFRDSPAVERAEQLYSLYEAYREIDELNAMVSEMIEKTRTQSGKGAQTVALTHIKRKLAEQSYEMSKAYAQERTEVRLGLRNESK